METLHFAHISDTHLTCGGSSPFMQRVAREVRDPWDNLKGCLCQLQGKALDFVLLTGDLVHEGEEEDYKALKRLLEEKLPGVPLCCAMGNHDHRLAFRRGFLGENTEDAGPYLAYTQVKGLGIITLDSPYLHGTYCTLPPDQLEFLRKSLEQKTPRGNIVILHHPVVGQQPWGPMEAPEEYFELLENGKVRGVFCWSSPLFLPRLAGRRAPLHRRFSGLWHRYGRAQSGVYRPVVLSPVPHGGGRNRVLLAGSPVT